LQQVAAYPQRNCSSRGELLVKNFNRRRRDRRGGARSFTANCPIATNLQRTWHKGEAKNEPTPSTKEDGGSDTTTYLMIGGAIAAAVVVLGSGAMLLLGRGRDYRKGT